MKVAYSPRLAEVVEQERRMGMNGSPDIRVKVRSQDFGMAVRYFFSLTEFEVLDVACGDEIEDNEIGEVFGDECVVIIGNTVDGQTWQVICDDPALSGCWIAEL
jgi:hypothetical protein